MTRLYLLTPPEIPDLLSFADQFKAVLDAADIACVQLRLKGAADDAWQRAIAALMPIAHGRDVAFVLNDRADLAHHFACDGVHLGKDDIGYDAARTLLGKDRIIGVSCYGSKDLAMDAAGAGADYVAFGSVFASSTKDQAPLVPLSILEDWIFIATTPCAAIGGITADNCAPLVHMGVEFLAVISAVWNYPGGPVAGAKALQRTIESA